MRHFRCGERTGHRLGHQSSAKQDAHAFDLHALVRLEM